MHYRVTNLGEKRQELALPRPKTEHQYCMELFPPHDGRVTLAVDVTSKPVFVVNPRFASSVASVVVMFIVFSVIIMVAGVFMVSGGAIFLL